jgi:hypothetical protein
MNSTKSREVIWGGRIITAAKINAEQARQRAVEAVREADRAGAHCALRMEGYGGPAQPSPTIAQCLNGGYGGRLVFRGWSITRRIWSIAAPDGWLVTLTGATETVGSRLG